MSWLVVELSSGARRCEDLQERLRNLPSWPPQLKMAIAEAIAECIVKILGPNIVEEIYYVDLSGGEPRGDYLGRDIDLIVKVSDELRNAEQDIEKILERYFNMELYGLLGEVELKILKPDVVEIHVISSFNSYWGRMVKSPFTYAIKIWPKGSN